PATHDDGRARRRRAVRRAAAVLAQPRIGSRPRRPHARRSRLLQPAGSAAPVGTHGFGRRTEAARIRLDPSRRRDPHPPVAGVDAGSNGGAPAFLRRVRAEPHSEGPAWEPFLPPHPLRGGGGERGRRGVGTAVTQVSAESISAYSGDKLDMPSNTTNHST